MISVQKSNGKIIVVCSKRELLNVMKIKEIVQTIKRVNNNENVPCTIILKSMRDFRFSEKGSVFYHKIKQRYTSFNKISFDLDPEIS